VANYEVTPDPFNPEALLLTDLPDTDDNQHGTHVASTVAGNDADGGHMHDGVAPGAKLYGYSINAGDAVLIAGALASFDDIIQKRKAGAPIVAISNSWGGGAGAYDPNDPLSILTKAAYDAGISVVFAAGNAGQEGGELNTASSECTMPWVVCAGAETKPGQLVQFSSRGRPSKTTEVTMPDGEKYTIDAGNHDRTLGQKMNIGVFRPTVTAPGVNIVAACSKSACGTETDYASLSGTSMATPHVSGVVALINSAHLGATGGLNLPSGNVINLLEATANPMPGWQLWEAGAGEVDAYEAVRVALGQSSATPPNFGAAPALLGAGTTQSFTDTAQPASWTSGVGYGEHKFNVSASTGRLELTLKWEGEENNLYMFAWRPGAHPNGADANRADQESWGLLEGLGPRLETFRVGTVVNPEPGEWTVRVYGRVNPTPVDYTLDALTRPAARPAVKVKSATASGGNVKLSGSATFPARPGEGITSESVPGTALPLKATGTPVQYWLHGDLSEADKPIDLFFDGGPQPFFDQEEPTDAVSQFQTGAWYGNPDFAGNFLLAYWRGAFEGSIQGDIPIAVWLSSETESLGGQVPVNFSGVDEAKVIGRTTVSGRGIASTPTKVEAVIPNVAYTVAKGPDGADRELVLQVSGAGIATDYFKVWYDSTQHPSTFSLPVLVAGGSSAPARPTGLTATDRVSGIGLSWNGVTGASAYQVYRSTDPTTVGTLIRTTSETTFTDTAASAAAPLYYRIAVLAGGVEGEPSDAVVGVRISDRRWVEVRAGRGPWEKASGTTSWKITLPRASGPGADPNTFTARSLTWAGVSTETVRTVR
jgi:hypothetical protein